MILIICLHLIQIHPLMTFKKLTHKSELSQIHLVPSVFPFRQNNLSVVFYYNFSFSPCTDTANAVKDSNPGSFPVPWRFWFSQQNGHVNLPKAQPRCSCCAPKLQPLDEVSFAFSAGTSKGKQKEPDLWLQTIDAFPASPVLSQIPDQKKTWRIPKLNFVF